MASSVKPPPLVVIRVCAVANLECHVLGIQISDFLHQCTYGIVCRKHLWRWPQLHHCRVYEVDDHLVVPTLKTN